jgi:hypothetical protein
MTKSITREDYIKFIEKEQNEVSLFEKAINLRFDSVIQRLETLEALVANRTYHATGSLILMD